MKTMAPARSKKSAPAPVEATPVEPAVSEASFKRLIEIFKSLADRSRLKILTMLSRQGEMHVSAICEELDQSQPAVSHHLTQLRNAGLVDFRRDGKFNYYRLDSVLVAQLLEEFFPDAKTAQQRVSFGDLELSFKRR
ncbi:ArsR/SmtB family transcription factor [Tuwongella immobilis]|uniref:HTH arsR-type domain-containing protein n=1 Tax=Tuwongella immobilis TaxID=692036 RepID=A0A6C2YR06_9BACT|nr:metalloregulator ArsR/SmtB family transcription factor [Tuwongella immobilis]VIP03312.1 family transcriptional regulator : Transcriptional regulator, ArsR family OS=Planctomyces brasiliensis (strain ATCC 49424 / DSM 5305 / JCM 21570 / NBRC 103401 / IFAM 1448) GN=Plabr_2662 PE=4 SV=1: HTH_5 [Tuwongella immobilis]VTS03995.1 family transcriptional regulator : Transcriptional regulator, ArsR family OS=Planctomyces brasiliensis (strain ATCC 49424 / DSM 5305 / JCM 21570 / NBRC 103401 / IFAM 1448) GN